MAPVTPDDLEELRHYAELLRSEAKRAQARARVVGRLAARLVEALTELEEAHRDDRENRD